MKALLVNDNLVAKFRRDRLLLPHDDLTISTKMGVTASYYTKSVNAGAIAGNFYYKFYSVFKEELKEIKESQSTANYRMLEYVDGEIRILKAKCEEEIRELTTRYEKVIQSHQEIIVEFGRLEKKFDRIMEQRLANIETMVASIINNKRRSTP